MKTESTKAAFFNLRILIGFALCSIGLLLALAGLSHTMTGTVVPFPDSTRWYVDGVNGSDSNDCKSRTTACKTIGHAISLAASGDSIKVAAATYAENLTISVNLKIVGTSASTTIIDGGHVNRSVFVESGAQVSLESFTIQNGITGFFGGGIFNEGGLVIEGCTVKGNTVSNLMFPEAFGGGIANFGTLTVNSSTISGNVASITSRAGTALGGGIYNKGTLTINNSTLSGNSASSSSGSSSGGGIWGGATISNSTITGNSAGTSGGGINNCCGTVILQNSIVANNLVGGNCSGTMTSDGYNLSSDGTCGFNNTGDLNNTDPLLGPLQDNGGPTETMALLSGSPAIDAGNPGGCTNGQGRLLKTDQRGMPRPDHEDTSGCDMGAYESQSD